MANIFVIFDRVTYLCKIKTINYTNSQITMKNLKRIFVAIALILAIGTSANAQIKFGVKAGVALNDLKFSTELDKLAENLDASNRAGFTGGVMLEVMLPVFNLGVDASVMYVHRSSELNFGNNITETLDQFSKIETSRDYIEVPINLKWKIGLPIVGNFVSPYIFTGPSFGILVSDVKNIEERVENNQFNVDWNFGIGVEIIKHVQIGASYGLGLTKAIKFVDKSFEGANIKNNYWTITAAYLF